MDSISKSEQLRVVIPAEQIQKRVREMARQISNDYRGQTIHALALLENGFIFMADLVRALEVPVICQFIKPQYRRQQGDGPGEMLEIFFSHEMREVDFLLLLSGAASFDNLPEQQGRKPDHQPEHYRFYRRIHLKLPRT